MNLRETCITKDTKFYLKFIGMTPLEYPIFADRENNILHGPELSNFFDESNIVLGDCFLMHSIVNYYNSKLNMLIKKPLYARFGLKNDSYFITDSIDAKIDIIYACVLNTPIQVEICQKFKYGK